MLRSFLRTLWRLIVVSVLLLALLAAGAVWFALQPLKLERPSVDITLERGISMREVSRRVVAQGVETSPVVLTWLARVSGRAHRIKAGDYRVEQGINAWQLIELLSEGANAYAELAVIEGWGLRRLRAALDAHPDLRHDTLGRTDAEVMNMLGMQSPSLEGWFYPDTYFFARGSTDLDVLRRAHERMQRVLDAEWQARTTGSALANPYEALVLASVVEKETGASADRGLIASVFLNRLRIGMPLQSDPTVIYGMGTDFDGNLRRRDLRTDTPHNTYTRRGLPPTPVALVGRDALRAVLQPPQSNYLYFVARGDGTSQFSRTLDEHNRAVSRFQRGGK